MRLATVEAAHYNFHQHNQYCVKKRFHTDCDPERAEAGARVGRDGISAPEARWATSGGAARALADAGPRAARAVPGRAAGGVK